MKIKLSFAFLFLCIKLAISQSAITLIIKDTKSQPLKNVVVTAENKAKNISVQATTDVSGTAVFNLTESGTYSFSYLEVKDVISAEVKEGLTSKMTRSITYDPKGVFAVKAKADRTEITFRNVAPQQLKGQEGAAKLTILLKEKNNTPVPNTEVSIVSIKERSIYTGKTNNSGQALFYVPLNLDYEVDVANLKAFHHLTVPNHKGLEMNETVYYEKTKISETVKGDTIRQQAISQTSGTSSHVLFTLQLNDYEGNVLPNEPVYMDGLSVKRVYQGKTDAKGQCSFMLEKGTDYTVNLKHERGIHLVTASVSEGFQSASANRRYRGSALIEKLVAEQKAEMERIAEEIRLNELKPKPGDVQYAVTYHETPVKTIGAPQNYLTKTTDGFNVDFKSSGEAGTPTVIENQLYSQEGLYSPNYYSLDATNGKYIWGLELGETGISPAVYHDGILLINTASCTLYAIEAKTGKLLWSKWLASYVYSTPTAADKSVFVVYNHGGFPVTVSFDLRTGKLNWMQRVDNEVIACAVVDGAEVHVASQNGSYYVFDKTNGKIIKTSKTYKLVSSPTLSRDKIYLTASFDKQEQLIVLNRKTLELEKKYPAKLTAVKISGERNVDETDQMNFNGSHPIVYKGKVVLLLDSKRIMAFDALSEALLWEKQVSTNSDQLPIVANDKVIITSSNGELTSYNIMTGASSLIKKFEDPIEGQAISANGFLYIAAAGIIRVIKNTQQYQWNQWNKDATHNTNWE